MAKKRKDEDTVIPADDKTTEEITATEEVTANPDTAPDPSDSNSPDQTGGEVESREAMTAEHPAKKRSNAPAWLALMLSAAALVAAAYLVVADWSSQSAETESSTAIESLSSRVDATRASLAALEKAIADVAEAGTNADAAADADIVARLGALQRNIDERVRTLDTLPTRMSGLESSVASLQGISAGTRDTWLLSEAENFMQIANAQLQLAGNPHLATLALGMADERISQLGNPALIDVRTALADELAALDVMVKPDIEGTTLMLASLARVIDSLPLRSPEQTARDTANADAIEEMGSFDRAFESVKDAMSGLVKVTPPDQIAAPLVSPDAVYFLRTNLALQLQVARLALLRGETAAFDQSLDDASAWLRQYFDTESAQVTASLQTIAEVRSANVAMSPPDISKSLHLLRQFRALAETAQ